jgi:SEC-C motif-containing protein
MTSKRHASIDACPCGLSITYAQCCGKLHAGALPPDAEALMRSRYSAYALGNIDYLLATWHPDTRPDARDLHHPALKWLGLDVRSHSHDGRDNAGVEFIARFRIGGGKAQRMHERSRFVRVDSRWLYLDGGG